MFGSFGWMELLLILFIVLIIFGAGKIPQLGEGLGKAIKGFKKSINEPDAMDVTPSAEQGSATTSQQLQEPQVAQSTQPQGNQVHVGAPGPGQDPNRPQNPPPPAQG